MKLTLKYQKIWNKILNDVMINDPSLTSMEIYFQTHIKFLEQVLPEANKDFCKRLNVGYGRYAEKRTADFLKTVIEKP